MLLEVPFSRKIFLLKQHLLRNFDRSKFGFFRNEDSTALGKQLFVVAKAWLYVKVIFGENMLLTTFDRIKFMLFRIKDTIEVGNFGKHC